MKLIYGKIQLDLVTIDSVNRTAVWTPDGTTLLYNEWEILCSCIYAPAIGNGINVPYSQHIGGTSVEIVNGVAGDINPAGANKFPTDSKVGAPGNAQVTSGDVPANVIPGNRTLSATFTGNGVPGIPAGSLQSQFNGNPNLRPFTTFVMPGSEYPIVTDRVLQCELAIPRQRLIITAWDPKRQTDLFWLVSPDFDRTCDAKNGPIVKASPVVQMHGDGQAFGVQLAITTWIPPCPGGEDKAILAHRWQMNHTQDDDYYLTRQVTGEIYLNSSVFNAPGNGVRGDFLTKEMFHPIPFGFRRNIDFVRRSPDGLVIAYGYSDTDQTVTFDAADTAATQMQIHETSAYIAPFTPVAWGIAQIEKDGAWAVSKVL